MLPLFSFSIVQRYHEWMQDPLLRQQTASEPLTLEQEYAMCASWEKDEDSRQGLTISCPYYYYSTESTFIVLSKELYDGRQASEVGGSETIVRLDWLTNG